MNVILLTDTEPEWTDVGLHVCDFRPHFNGHLHNLFTTVHPLQSRSETEQLFRKIAFEMADWVLSNRERFGLGDRFQMIVGWPLAVRPTGRQVVKTGGDFDALQRLIDDRELIRVREGWAESVFQNGEKG